MTHFKTRSAKIDKNSRFKQPGTIGIGKYLSAHTRQNMLCNQYLNNNTSNCDIGR